MFLLDTNIISNFRKTKPHPNLLAWMARVDLGELAISVITVFEIQAGIQSLKAINTAKAAEIEEWLEGMVIAGGMSILPVDTGIARLYAAMFSTPALKNFTTPHPASQTRKSGADLIIA